MESSSSHSKILLLRTVLRSFFRPPFFVSSAFFLLLRLAASEAASRELTGSTASAEHEHTRPAPNNPSASFLSTVVTGSLPAGLGRSNLALRFPPLATLLDSVSRGAYTSGEPTTPSRMTPHAAGGADPVLRRRRAADVAAELPLLRGGRADGLG